MLSSRKKNIKHAKSWVYFPLKNLFPEKTANISTIYLIREKNVWSFNLLIVLDLLTYSDLGSMHIPCFLSIFLFDVPFE